MSDRAGSGRRRGWESLPGKAAPTPMRDALDQLASTMGLGSVDGINRLFLAWEEIVGADLATKCAPKRLSDGVLIVEAADQQWATELSWMTDLIAERCGAAVGIDEVTEVRIVRPTLG